MGMVDFNIKDAGEAIGGLFTGIREAFTGEKITDPNQMAELRYKFAELETRWKDFRAKIAEYQHNVIVAEAKSESWLARNWRPVTMLTFVFIIANNYILVPYMSALFGVTIPALELTTDMWELLKIGIGGYVVGRSVEKSVKVYSDAKGK